MDDLPSRGGDQRVSGRSPLVDIVIVNWNTGNQLRECLRSIAEHGRDLVASLIVVDNGSTDDSLAGLDCFDLPLMLICNDENRGFAAACNQGAKSAAADYILFLNPDTRLFEGSLTSPLGYLSDGHDDRVGICGIQLLDETGHVARSCARFPTFLRYVFEVSGLAHFPPMRKFGIRMADWGHDSTKIVGHVIGAFFFVRRDLFQCLGGFDERFFVYLEDLDFSYRANLAGWRSVYLADAQAFHAGGGSSRQVKAARLFYSLRSRILYAFKHFNEAEAWAVLLLTLFVEPFTRSVYALSRGAFREMRGTARGYRMLWRDLPRILKIARGRHD